MSVIKCFFTCWESACRAGFFHWWDGIFLGSGFGCARQVYYFKYIPWDNICSSLDQAGFFADPLDPDTFSIMKTMNVK